MSRQDMSGTDRHLRERAELQGVYGASRVWVVRVDTLLRSRHGQRAEFGKLWQRLGVGFESMPDVHSPLQWVWWQRQLRRDLWLPGRTDVQQRGLPGDDVHAVV